jgi:hypothetical protein
MFNIKNQFKYLFFIFIQILIYKPIFSSENNINKFFDEIILIKDKNTISYNDEIFKIVSTEYSIFEQTTIEDFFNETIKENSLDEDKLLFILNSLENEFKIFGTHEEKESFKKLRNAINSLILIFKKNNNIEIYNLLEKIFKEIYKIKSIKSYLDAIEIDSKEKKSEKYKLNRKYLSIPILSLFWAIYFINLIKNNKIKNIENEQTLRFIINFPIRINYIKYVLKKIQLEKSIRNLLKNPENLKMESNTKIEQTEELYIKSILEESIPRFANEEMALDIINRRILFMKLLENDLDSKKRIELLINKFLEIQNSTTSSNININLIENVRNYFEKIVPYKLFGRFDVSGKNSNELTFIAQSLYVSWKSTILNLISMFGSDLLENEDSNRARIEALKKYRKIDSSGFLSLLKSSLVYAFSYKPISSIVFNSGIIENFIKKNIFKSNIFDFMPLAIKFIPFETGNEITFLDIHKSLKEMGIYRNVLKNHIMQGTISSIFTLGKWTVESDLFQGSINEILNEISIKKQIFTYFKLLMQRFNICKELYEEVENLYKKNNIPVEFMTPEIKNAKETIKNNKVMNFLSKKNVGIKNSIKIIFFSGLIAHFYFNNIEKETKIFEILTRELGSISSTIKKLEILNFKKKGITETCIPKLNKTIFTANYSIYGMWYPAMQSPSNSSIKLDNKNRNILLTAPINSGKTTTMATILTSLFLSNSGIAPANNLNFTFFYDILTYLGGGNYTIGDGESGGTEQASFIKAMKHAIERNEKNKLCTFCFFDEIYQVTNTHAAIALAKKNISPLLRKKLTCNIVSSHIPEMVKITEDKESSISVYYLEVLYDKINKTFQKTYKIKPNDDGNWWINDKKIDLQVEYDEFIENNKNTQFEAKQNIENSIIDIPFGFFFSH